MIIPIISFLSSCAQKKPAIHSFITKQFVLGDTSAAANQFTYTGKDIDFPIYYIGPVKDTISIGRKYCIGRTQAPSLPFGFPASRNYYEDKEYLRFGYLVGADLLGVFLNMELKDKYGRWMKIGKKISELGICGTGQPSIYLGPGDVPSAPNKNPSKAGVQ